MSTIPAVPPKYHLQLRLLDIHGDPLKKGTPCWLETADEIIAKVQIQDDGILDAIVPAKKTVILSIYALKDGDLTTQPITFELEPREEVGNPDQLAGLRARLNNLGYLSLRPGAPLDGPMDDALARALARFRFANELSEAPPAEKAAIDAKTAERLRTVHDEGKAFYPQKG